MHKARKLFLMGMLLVSQSLWSQKIQVSESSETVDNVARTGLYTVIDLDSKHIEEAWKRHLKTFGKLNASKGFLILPVANVSEVSSKPASIYSKILSTPQGAKVWWAIDLGDGYATSASNHSAYKGAEKILHEFAVACYKDDINEQIKEAEKAYAASVRNHERDVRHGEQLTRNVDNNQQEKVRLETLLKQNAAELEQLKKDIELNKKAQAESVSQSEKMKQAIEVVKAKMDHIQ